MEKLSRLRSMYRSTRCFRSYEFRATAIKDQPQNLSHGFRHYVTPSSSSSSNQQRSFFSLSHPTIAAASSKRISLGCQPHFLIGIGSIRSFCAQYPAIRDRDIQNVFKDFMAISWEDLPDAVIKNAKKALSKNTKDTAGREALANVFRAAEAVEEFGGILVSLRMEIDDMIGMSGEKIGPLPDDHAYALDEVYKRYEEYLDAFGSDEEYLRNKVETELGAKMIHLKMRCSFIDTQWGKVTVVGTSGLSGSYFEQRAL